MRIVDFHSHILPGVDDGSQNADMTGLMLARSAKQGVRVMAATPHFYGDRDSIDHFLKKRQKAWESALPLAEDHGMELVAGAEVAYFDNMSQAKGIERLTLGGSRVLLLEMPFRAWGSRDIQELERLLHGGYRVILAHLERYIGFQKDKGVLEAVWDSPLLVQLNAECLLDFWQARKFLKLFRDGKAHLLGTDCHNLSSRPPNLAEGRAAIEKKLGYQVLEEIDRRGEKILEMIP